MFTNPSHLVAERLKKIASLRSQGIDPYPAEAFGPVDDIASIHRSGDALVRAQAAAKIAGRVSARRVMGRLMFIDLFDSGLVMQAMISQDDVGDGTWNVLELADLGDFMGVTGNVMRTRTGELSIRVKSITLLGKPTHPVPLPKRGQHQTFERVTDKGLLYRQRHVDLLTHEGTRQRLITRARIIRGIRKYLDDDGFVEVETPVIGAAYGGAAARPFVTHVNALDEEMYLRISPECALKRLLCGGLNRVYELGKNFRNESIDGSHSPEFTMLEFYEAFADYGQHLTRFENLVAGLAEEIHGATRIRFRGKTLDLTPPWRRIPVLDALREQFGMSFMDMDRGEIIRLIAADGDARTPESIPTWGHAVMRLFEQTVEHRLWNPAFVMDHPLEVSPLTKRHRGNPQLVERFEPMIAGMEVGNAYSELNDPRDQYERLVEQQGAREDVYQLDHEFLQAIAHGMPPAAGTGMGVDRIVMILTEAESIRDVIAFPLLGIRPTNSLVKQVQAIESEASDPSQAGLLSAASEGA